MFDQAISYLLTEIFRKCFFIELWYNSLQFPILSPIYCSLESYRIDLSQHISNSFNYSSNKAYILSI